MDSTLTYALLTGVGLVILVVIVKAALRLAFKVFAFLIVLAALALGTWLWLNYSDRQSSSEKTASPSRRATPAQR
jgi:uncharacterized membrane protein YwaF